MLPVAAACVRSLETLLQLGEQLTPADWERPTACPLWRVADIYAHVNGVEAWLAAGGTPYEMSTQDFIDTHVAGRRDQAPTDLLAELRALSVVRREQLSSLEGTPAVFIPVLRAHGPMEVALRFRVFDLWTHEQDVRTAVNRPGNLGGPPAEIVRDILLTTLPRAVAKIAGAPPSSAVQFVVTGDVPLDVAVIVTADGRGSLGPAPADPAVRLAMSWEAFTRLSAGRGGVDDHRVDVVGDQELAARILPALNVAP
jgi:uncharacterized protein (TIGR03083 family)